jgi:hypothetical protein
MKIFILLIFLPFISYSQIDEIDKQIQELQRRKDSINKAKIFIKNNNEINKNEVENYGIRLLKDFSNYLSVIADKKNPIQRRNNNIDAALELFINDSTLVEVTKIHSNNIKGATRTIKKYLYNLRDLKYRSVEVIWSDFALSKELKKGQDGRYYGVAKICQRFNASTFNNNEYSMKYDIQQITCKDVEIVVEEYVKLDGGKEWIVKLGNINVKENYAN